MVHNHRNAAIGPQLGEPRLLLNILRDVDSLPCEVFAVGLLQFFENDGSFPAIGRAPRQELNALVGFQARRSFVAGHVGEYAEKGSRCVEVCGEAESGSLNEAFRGVPELY